MPADPPPIQPSRAEIWHMEEMRRRQIIEAERQRVEHEEWWASLSEEERKEVERLRALHQAETDAYTEEGRRSAEREAAAHRRRIEVYEDSHGGSGALSGRHTEIKRLLNSNRAPTVLSTGGTLLVLAFFALIPGLILNGAMGSAGGGILLAELLALTGWAIWVQRRRERFQLRTALEAEQRVLSRQVGCGDRECRECYLDQRQRSSWSDQLVRISRTDGCGDAGCRACYT